jgi:peptidoglycan hydrolase CwlO-like protein
MVATDINSIFDHASIAKTAAYDAMLHSQSGNNELCQLKLKDFQNALKEMQKQVKDLEQKIDYLKNQG